MKKIIFMLTVLTLIFNLSSCGAKLKGDYDDPEALIDAHEAIHTEWENNASFDDLEGKTFVIKATRDLDKKDPLGDVEKSKGKEGYNWMCSPYSSLESQVIVWLTEDQWNRIEYKKGDTMLLKTELILQRGSKNGEIRQYYIFAYWVEE